MYQLSRSVIGGHAGLLQAGLSRVLSHSLQLEPASLCTLDQHLSQLPFCSGTGLQSHSWFSCTAGASTNGGEKAYVAAHHVDAFASAYKQRLGTEPPSRLHKFYAKTITTENRVGYLVQKLDEWIDTFGKTTTERIMRRQPSILTRDTATVLARFTTVCKLYGWSKEEGVSMVHKNASILAFALERHTSWRKHLANILKIPEVDVGKVLMKFPILLNLAPQNIAISISALDNLMSGAIPEFRQLILKTPALLCFKPETLALKVSRISLEFNPLLPFDARLIFAATPALLSRNPAVLIRKFHALNSACQKDTVWMEAFRNMKPSVLASSLCYSEKTFARLDFYQAFSPPKRYAFRTLFNLPEKKFNAMFPDFEEWWQNRGQATKES